MAPNASVLDPAEAFRRLDPAGRQTALWAWLDRVGPDARALWSSCPRGDWLAWWLGTQPDDQQRLVLACAEGESIPYLRRKAVRTPCDLTVEVTGFQWGWQFRYPDRNVTITGTAEAGQQPTLVLPAGRTARLVLRTTDVNHSFWVPAFLEKRDLIAGVDNAIDVTPTTEGTFDGKCAEFCALDHWRMTFTLEVVARSSAVAAVRPR